METHIHFTPTGIGSVPFFDIRETCLHILKTCPEMPFWPQFVKRSPLEDMRIQYSEGLPLIELAEDHKGLTIASREPEAELVRFYDKYLADEVDAFAISRPYAPGLYEMIDLIRENPEPFGPFIKGQSTGPVTFAASLKHGDGKPILHHPDLLDAVVRGLAIRALWQVEMLAKSGKRPIIFLDEPGLSGFGSAFSAIERHEVIRLLKEVIDYLKEKTRALIGIHCCGNTDWPMILETGTHIVSFDAFSYMDTFLLYPEAISDFMEKGGMIAWGIVPTSEFTGEETVDVLFSKLQKGLNSLAGWGLDPDMTAAQSLLTPSCGMGTMAEGFAKKALDLLCLLSQRCGAAR